MVSKQKLEVAGFAIEKQLNPRGKGSVYKAIQLSVERPVALKVMKRAKGNLKAMEKFKSEARTLAQISHPNVVQVVDLVQQSTGLVIVMELVNGNDLADRFKRLGLLNQATALDYMQQAAEGLLAAHSKGVVHRDIKPGNLLLTLDDKIKITDFGIAQNFAATGPEARGGATMGTTHYVSPEQAQGGEVDRCSDVYSLGATFYHLCSGEPPYPDKDFKTSLKNRATKKPMPLNAKVAGISRAFGELVGSMLDPDINTRTQGMAQVVDGCKRIRLMPAEKTDEAVSVKITRDLQGQQIRELNLIEMAARDKILGRGALNDALEIQRNSAKESKFISLEKVIMDNKLITEEDFIKVTNDLDHLLQFNENKRAMNFLKRFMDEKDHVYKGLDRASEKQGVVLTKMLEKEKMLSEKDLAKLKALVNLKYLNDYEKTLAALVTEHKLVNKLQIDDVFKLKKNKSLAQYLIDEAYLKNEELLALLDVQKIRTLEHFFSHDLVVADIRFRDDVACPHCGKSMFVDDDECKHCRKSIHQKRSDKTQSYSMGELETVKEADNTMAKAEWFIKTDTAEAGPYTLQKIIGGIGSKQVNMFTKIRRGENEDFKEATRQPFIARVFGLCFNCSELRSKKVGPCPSCKAVEK
jgi:serine/threonine protein kinase